MNTGIEPQRSDESRENDRELVSKSVLPVHVVVGGSPAARPGRVLADAPPITPRRQRTRNKWRRRLIALAVLATAGVAAAIYREPLKRTVNSYLAPKTSVNLANIQTYTVKRGELRITMVEEGKLRAVNNWPIRLGISGKITWLADAGSKVKMGDKLASVDPKTYEDQKRTMEQDLEQQQRLMKIAESAIPIAEADGNAAISTANNALATAELALKQYKDIDSRKKLNDLETAVNDARTKLADQQKKRIDVQTQLDSMLTEGKDKDDKMNELRLAKQSEESLRRAVANADDQRKLFRSNNYPQELKTKERLVENAKLDVEKAKIKKSNDVLAKQGEVGRYNNLIIQRLNNIRQMDDYITRSVATAPTDGLVFYGSPDLEIRGMSIDQIRVGSDWSSQVPIMSIPDLSAFQVSVPIAEVYRGRVSVGMPATVMIDAVPGLVLEGKLKSVSSVSRPKFLGDQTSPPVYDAILSLDVADPRMVAGMTVRVEIVTATLPDVLHVPVEAVFNEEGKTAAFVWVEGKGPNDGYVEKRPVLTGQASDHFVEIKKGATETDKLLLSRPTAFVTPHDYRERMDAMFPASLAAAAKTPATAPSGGRPADAAASTTRPIVARRGGVPGSPPAPELSPAMLQAVANPNPPTSDVPARGATTRPMPNAN